MESRLEEEKGKSREIDWNASQATEAWYCTEVGLAHGRWNNFRVMTRLMIRVSLSERNAVGQAFLWFDHLR